MYYELIMITVTAFLKIWVGGYLLTSCIWLLIVRKQAFGWWTIATVLCLAVGWPTVLAAAIQNKVFKKDGRAATSSSAEASTPTQPGPPRPSQNKRKQTKKKRKQQAKNRRANR